MVLDLETVGKHCSQLVNFMLNNSETKIPIKQSTLTALVNSHGENFKHSFESSKQKLAETYGLDLIEVPNTKATKNFIIVPQSKILCTEQFDEGQKRQNLLLFLILNIIFMKGGSISENDLKSFLSSLDIDIDEEHDYFGPDLKKLITETFTKQLYLKRTKTLDEKDSIAVFYYSWGFRSTREFQKIDVLNTSAKLMGKPVESFASQYESAHKTEEEEAAEVAAAEEEFQENIRLPPTQPKKRARN